VFIGAKSGTAGNWSNSSLSNSGDIVAVEVVDTETMDGGRGVVVP
jgi:hypothetical protein